VTGSIPNWAPVRATAHDDAPRQRRSPVGTLGTHRRGDPSGQNAAARCERPRPVATTSTSTSTRILSRSSYATAARWAVSEAEKAHTGCRCVRSGHPGVRLAADDHLRPDCALRIAARVLGDLASRHASRPTLSRHPRRCGDPASSRQLMPGPSHRIPRPCPPARTRSGAASWSTGRITAAAGCRDVISGQTNRCPVACPDPTPCRSACELSAAATTTNACSGQVSTQPEPGRNDLVGHCYRTYRVPNPGSDAYRGRAG
jgi:hypothetical protein